MRNLQLVTARLLPWLLLFLPSCATVHKVEQSPFVQCAIPEAAAIAREVQQCNDGGLDATSCALMAITSIVLPYLQCLERAHEQHIQAPTVKQ